MRRDDADRDVVNGGVWPRDTPFQATTPQKQTVRARVREDGRSRRCSVQQQLQRCGAFTAPLWPLAFSPCLDHERELGATHPRCSHVTCVATTPAISWRPD